MRWEGLGRRCDERDGEDRRGVKCGNGGKNKGNDCPWDPFHPDVQRTVHFWGYHGSLTEPPCSNKVLFIVF